MKIPKASKTQGDIHVEVLGASHTFEFAPPSTRSGSNFTVFASFGFGYSFRIMVEVFINHFQLGFFFLRGILHLVDSVDEQTDNFFPCNILKQIRNRVYIFIHLHLVLSYVSVK